MTTEAIQTGERRVKVSLGGEERDATEATWQVVGDELVKKYGGVPKVALVEGVDETQVQVQQVQVQQPAPVVALDVPGSGHSLEGALRSGLDELAAVSGGFAPAQPLYRRGTKVIDLGVENARASRQEHDAKPLVSEYVDSLVAQIKSEHRRDLDIPAFDVRMDKEGRLVLPDPEASRLVLSERAFPSLCNRLGFGGSSYLSKCWPALRAKNVNQWTTALQQNEQDAQKKAAEKKEVLARQQVTLRLRDNPKVPVNPEVFGVVSTRYSAFDVDLVAEAIKLAVPSEARGTVHYDGNRARFEIMFHSNVQPEKYVAGEFFKGGLIIGTDDTGLGSVWGSATLWQNLCLNLIVIDEARQPLFRLKHLGSVEALATRFRAGIELGKEKLGHFIKQWGYACEDNIIEAAQKIQPEVPLSIEEALPGFYRGLLEAELVPLKGYREDNIPKLVEMYQKDVSGARQDSYITRASLVNSITRYAHEVNDDPWAEHGIEQAAGALVWSKKPLPWLGEAV